MWKPTVSENSENSENLQKLCFHKIDTRKCGEITTIYAVQLRATIRIILIIIIITFIPYKEIGFSKSYFQY